MCNNESRGICDLKKWARKKIIRKLETNGKKCLRSSRRGEIKKMRKNISTWLMQYPGVGRFFLKRVLQRLASRFLLVTKINEAFDRGNNLYGRFYAGQKILKQPWLLLF